MAGRKRFTKKQRQEVWAKYDGHCAYCGCELDYKDMQVDHIESVYRHEYLCDGMDVNVMDNYNPACRMCNFYKSTGTLKVFRMMLSGIIGRLKKIFIFRLALKYGLISINDRRNIEFYFERARK